MDSFINHKEINGFQQVRWNGDVKDKERKDVIFSPQGSRYEIPFPPSLNRFQRSVVRRTSCILYIITDQWWEVTTSEKNHAEMYIVQREKKNNILDNKTFSPWGLDSLKDLESTKEESHCLVLLFVFLQTGRAGSVNLCWRWGCYGWSAWHNSTGRRGSKVSVILYTFFLKKNMPLPSLVPSGETACWLYLYHSKLILMEMESDY